MSESNSLPPAEDVTTEAKTNKNTWHPTTLLSYVFGGFSLLNLVNDFNIIKLRGLVKSWSDAFSSFILGIRDYLFGWIEISWLSISNIESYLLVISFLFVSSLSRAYMNDVNSNSSLYTNNPKGYMMATIVILYLIIFFIFSLFALLLPNVITITIMGIMITFVSLYLMLPSKDKDQQRTTVMARSNLIGSFVTFLVLVALNYGLQI